MYASRIYIMITKGYFRQKCSAREGESGRAGHYDAKLLSRNHRNLVKHRHRLVGTCRNESRLVSNCTNHCGLFPSRVRATRLVGWGNARRCRALSIPVHFDHKPDKSKQNRWKNEDHPVSEPMCLRAAWQCIDRLLPRE